MAKRITKTYDQELKSQAVKLAQKIGGHKAAEELGVPSGTIYSLQRGSFRAQNVHTLSNALSLNEELIELRKRIKEMDKENKRLKQENEFLEEASTFFQPSIGSQQKTKINVHSYQNARRHS